MRSRVRLRPIYIPLVAGFLLFCHCKSFQKYHKKQLLQLLSPIKTNLHTTCRGIIALPPLLKLPKISQQTAYVITKERWQIKNSANLPNAIQMDENSCLNSPTVFETENSANVISKCSTLTRMR